jgi:hypothetical protein
MQQNHTAPDWDSIDTRTKLTRGYFSVKPKRRGCKRSSLYLLDTRYPTMSQLHNTRKRGGARGGAIITGKYDFLRQEKGPKDALEHALWNIKGNHTFKKMPSKYTRTCPGAPAQYTRKLNFRKCTHLQPPPQIVFFLACGVPRPFCIWDILYDASGEVLGGGEGGGGGYHPPLTHRMTDWLTCPPMPPNYGTYYLCRLTISGVPLEKRTTPVAMPENWLCGFCDSLQNLFDFVHLILFFIPLI